MTDRIARRCSEFQLKLNGIKLTLLSFRWAFEIKAISNLKFQI